MTEDERAILQAQATILAGMWAANATLTVSDDCRPWDWDDLVEMAQAKAHQLAQNLDLHTGASR